MHKVKALIIDDEPLGIELVQKYLEEFAEIEVKETCSNGFEGLKAIQQYQPDLVFLDVQMPKISGFELLELLDNPPMVIFTTAYDKYALQAFERNAVDYLLKPFSQERFRQAVSKALHNQTAGAVKKLTPDWHSGELADRIVVRNGNRIVIIPQENIHFLEAEDDYVNIHSSQGKYLKQQTLKFYEKSLDPGLFQRVHRSFLVRLDQIVQLEPFEKNSYRLRLKTGAILPVSRQGYTRLREVLNF
jgi:two-component system LytT family response regulator